MAKKTNVSMVIRNLRKVEVLQSQGRTVAQACKEINVSEQTYYRWRKQYGRLSLDQARRLNELEDENSRLKSSLDLKIFAWIMDLKRGAEQLAQY